MFITGSYDPNDIQVNRSFLYDYELASPPNLEDLIRFQNTGNDTAFYVEIKNPVSAMLDVSTFEMLDVSHSCNPVFNHQDSILHFVFHNILLPDSNINEPASHGFVRYRVKPYSNLVVGDSILNTAGIIFDLNTPVITNTAVTEVILPVSLDEIKNTGIHVYPNPVKDKLQIRMDITERESVLIQLFDVYGRKIRDFYSGTLNPGVHDLRFDVSDLGSGIYFISGAKMGSCRFAKL